jgi:Ca2+-binding RTX toxin-like protein
MAMPGAGKPKRRGSGRPLIWRAAFEALEDRTLLSVLSDLVYPGPDGHLVYVPNAQGDVIPNFSQVGYETGVVPLPDTPNGYTVPVAITINPSAGDQTTIIQNAINTVSALPLNAEGFRGAILLTAGNYPIAGSLNIDASGVVLEGQGNNATTGTRLEATGTSTRMLINISGTGNAHPIAGTTHNITDNYVPVGATTFDVDSTAGLTVGQSVIVERPSTQAWLDAIGANLLANPWQPGTKNLDSDRVITAINGNQITIDAPLTNSLDQQYGGGTIYAYTWGGRISQVGLENLYTYSDEVSNTDANHAGGMLDLSDAENCWVNNVTANDYSSNEMELNSAKWLTIDNSTFLNISQTGAAPPTAIGIQSQLTLIENSTFFNTFHAMAVGADVPGPDVYYNDTAGGYGGQVGPHQRWSSGGLFDNVTVTGTQLEVFNAANEGTGHGWQGANYVFWNDTGSDIIMQEPPTAQNWVIGGEATKHSGSGIFDDFGEYVTPQSLYVAQLLDRETPTVATPAAAAPGVINAGGSTILTVLGADAAPVPSLTYTWSVVSRPPDAALPTFSSTNGTSAGKRMVATFPDDGAYTLEATIQFPGGFSVTSDVSITVKSGVVSIVVLPATTTVTPGGNQTFTATAYDSTGDPLISQPDFIWSLIGSSVGTISASGVFTAGATPGVAIVQATAGTVVGVAAVAVTNAGPMIVQPAEANPSPVTGSTAALSTTATESGTTLTYTWSVIAEPSGGGATFSDNGDTSAQTTTATFTAAGEYTFLVVVSDGANLAISSVEVPVDETLSGLASSPASVEVDLATTEQFGVSGVDQFGNVGTFTLTPTWSVDGGGTIDANSGLFTAGDAAGGPYTVTVTDGGFQTTDGVTVVNNLLDGEFEGAVSTQIPGATQSIAYQINNVGLIAAEEPITTNLYLETKPSLGNGDMLLSSQVDSTANLAAGRSMSGIASFTLPDFSGSYYLVAQILGGAPGSAAFQRDNTFASGEFEDYFNLALGTLTLAGGNSGANSLTASLSAGNILLALNGIAEPSTPVSDVNAIMLDAGAASASIDVGAGLPPVIVRDALLNNFVSVQGGTLTVTAAPSGNNVIDLSSTGSLLLATENATSVSVSLTNVNAIYVNGGGGSDSIAIGSALPAMTVTGGSGSDTVAVHNVAGDVITGGASNNYLIGGSAADTLMGGGGKNTIASGMAADLLVGGSGDNFFINGNATGGKIRGGSGLNFAQFNPSEKMTNITEVYDAPMGSGDYPAPDPLFRSTVTAKVVDTPQGTMLKIFGTPGNDTISVTSSGADVLVKGNGAAVGSFQTSGLSGIRIFGGAGNDALSVNSSVTLHVTMRGGGGNDSLTGGGGDNLLIGGGGNDMLTGGGGVNILVAGNRNFNSDTGDDLLVGGSGFNIADFSGRTDNLYLSNDGRADSGDASAGEAITIMPSVQAIWGGAGNDTIVGTVAGEFLSGGSGDASIQGGGTGDMLVGGLGKDTVSVAAEPVSLFMSGQSAGIYIGVNNPDEDILELGGASSDA